MKKTIKTIVLFAFILFINNAKAQYGIGDKLYNIYNQYSDIDLINQQTILDNNAVAIEYDVELKSCTINYISSFGYEGKYFITNDGDIYTTCDKVIISPKDDNNFIELINEFNSNWVKINSNKWSFDNKEKKIKSVAEVITLNNKKSISIKGTCYGKRDSQFRGRN
jgi:hypothetical protein